MQTYPCNNDSISETQKGILQNFFWGLADKVGSSDSDKDIDTDTKRRHDGDCCCKWVPSSCLVKAKGHL